MSVSPVSSTQPMAQPQQARQTGGKYKAVASAFVPGLGQFLDGRDKAGAGYMVATALSVGVLNQLLAGVKGLSPAELVASLSKTKLAVGAVATALASGIWIANIVNAYKGEKTSK